MKVWSVIVLALVCALSACKTNTHAFDASGSFEADETLISAEASGILKQFNIEEGQLLEAGDTIGYVDSTQLSLQKIQLESQIRALLSKKPNISVQLAALGEQLKTAEKEKTRITNLVNADAAPRKQLDDINAQIEVIQRQISAQRSTLSISSEGLTKDAIPLNIQVDLVEEMLRKCRIINPIQGTVLLKYAEQYEMTAPGKALYSIADMSNMILRTYVSGNQLASIKLNQKVKVSTDDGNGGFKETDGTIIWISDKAEFTPKTIQTKEERANMVYAIKVKVKNDGTYKIGMYGEIKL